MQNSESSRLSPIKNSKPAGNSCKKSNHKLVLFMAILSYFMILLPLPGQSKSNTQILKLKTIIEVQNDIVTLGDIFENIEKYRSEPVFRSPNLGRQGTIRLERLIDAAERYGFTFDTPMDTNKITISRPARTIPASLIKSELKEKIAKTYDPKFNPTIKSGNHLEYRLEFVQTLEDKMVPVNYSGKIKLKSFKLNKLSGSFTATFIPLEDVSETYNISLTGKTTRVQHHPIINRTLNKGEKITANDIEMRAFIPGRIPKNSIRNTSSLIGMTTKRALSAGSFVKASDIEMPRLIKKNELVTLILETKGMSLKTQGKAMDDAGLNESIAIQNLQSKRIVHGKVTAPGFVMVQYMSPEKILKTAQLAK